MSFIDLATLTMHRRAEMEGRINTFDEKCDRAINDIKRLKLQAHSFVSQLNCDPAELKDRFLNFMKKLDEYTYLITDFNLAMGQIEEITSSEFTPVQDNSIPLLPVPSYSFDPNNLMDALSEPAPSTSSACTNLCPPEKPKRDKVPKKEQVLIAFSSSSTSSESVPSRKSEMVAKEVQCSLTEEMASICIEESSPESPEPLLLPAQVLLEVDREYHGVITALAGVSFWIITGDSNEFANFMHDITAYYRENETALTMEQARSLTYCALYDEETKFYYRALYIKEDEEEADRVSLFLVDTGEIRVAAVQALRPLAAPYCTRAPYAHLCHLAGINLKDPNDKLLMRKFESIMSDYVNAPCVFFVDENESESAGVYVSKPAGETLNHMLVRRGLAVPIDKSPTAVVAPRNSSATSRNSPTLTSNSPTATRISPVMTSSPVLARGPPEIVDSELDLDAPEYDDPVEAVTGYHNRDEEDICKHYKGGPNKTCFKGARCNKRHVMKHPDGWTLDRVEVIGKIKPTPLPAPGSWIKVLVTAVPHFDRIYVNLVDENQPPEEVPEFGVVRPPTTLKSLVRDMNSPAARAAYKPLQFAPAPGEVVAALYPPDGCWYRASVRMATRGDQSVEVQYIDYGTDMWIKEDQIRVLEAQYTLLPAQGVRCLLAGVFMSSENSQEWVRARRALHNMIQDKVVHCHVIARDYDEITVELVDNEDYSVAEQLAAQGLVELRAYSLAHDAHLAQKVVVP